MNYFLNLKVGTLFFLLICLHPFTQAQTINPKKGKISFSWKKKDSTLTTLYLLGKRIEPTRKQVFVHEFQDSIIRNFSVFHKENGVVETGDSNFISRKLALTYGAGEDNVPLFDQTYPYPYKDYIEETFIVTEYRSDIKNIANYECFRVVIEGLQKFDLNHEIVTTYDMYVTEEIKCKYHPVLEAKKFLNQYYPLEINTKAILNNSTKNPTDYEKQLGEIFKTQVGKSKKYIIDDISIE